MTQNAWIVTKRFRSKKQWGNEQSLEIFRESSESSVITWKRDRLPITSKLLANIQYRLVVKAPWHENWRCIGWLDCCRCSDRIDVRPKPNRNHRWLPLITRNGQSTPENLEGHRPLGSSLSFAPRLSLSRPKPAASFRPRLCFLFRRNRPNLVSPTALAIFRTDWHTQTPRSKTVTFVGLAAHIPARCPFERNSIKKWTRPNRDQFSYDSWACCEYFRDFSTR